MRGASTAHLLASLTVDSLAQVFIHESQFPRIVLEQLKHSLHTRRVSHKFHYQTHRQVEKWHLLHQKYAPFNHDAECREIYSFAAEAAASQVGAEPAAVIGLCCGYGEKELELLQALQKYPRPISFCACDGSVAMVLRATETVVRIIAPAHISRVVCDLENARDMSACFASLLTAQSKRIYTFFGSLHNFEPNRIFLLLANLLQPGDQLLFSTNLVAETGYASAVESILPQYQNELTQEWLSLFVSDVGIRASCGTIQGGVESCGGGTELRRIALYFKFGQNITIKLAEENFEFSAGERMRLFFSYRYTVSRVLDLLARNGLKSEQHWVTRSGEEGVFLCGRSE